MFSHILYKMINNLVFSILNLCRVLGLNAGSVNKSIFLDINHSTTHLGDRLFLWDLIFFENSIGRPIYVAQDDAISRELFCALGLHVLPCKTPFKDVHMVSLKPKFLNDLLNEPRQTLFKTYLDYYTFDQPLSKAILARLRGYEKDRSFECARPKRKLISHSSSKVVLFNNYLDSGIFRKKFVDHTKLADRADELARAGFEIWHVGSSSDKLNDKSVYNFVSKDLRGTTSISDIVKLFSSGLIVRVVSFDNFYLHLAELYELPSDILFRGRFTSKARRVHFASVNVGLERTKNRISYL